MLASLIIVFREVLEAGLVLGIVLPTIVPATVPILAAGAGLILLYLVLSWLAAREVR